MLYVVETFSGLGSQAKALERTNIEHEIIATCDWDINAIIAYDLMHNGEQDLEAYQRLTNEEIDAYIMGLSISNNGKSPLSDQSKHRLSRLVKEKLICAIERTNNMIDITSVNGDDLPAICNLLTYSFPCQDLSIAGSWQGNEGGIERNAGNRSSLLWEIDRILNERYRIANGDIAMPRFLLMENVSNILSRTHRPNFDEWIRNLEGYGYENLILTLDARNFGVPQSRVRTYMVSVYVNDNAQIREYVDEMFRNVNENNLHELYRCNEFHIRDILCDDYDNGYYLLEALESNPNATVSRLQIYENNIHIGEETAYVPTITTKQDRHPNAGLIDFNLHADQRKANFRYLTPRECFKLMGFDEEDYQRIIDNNFRKGNSMFFSRDKLNRLAGNSICVNVLEAIFRFIDEMENFIEELA